MANDIDFKIKNGLDVGGAITSNGNAVLTTADEGSIDAGTLDSLDSTQFVRNDTTGTQTVASNLIVGDAAVDNGGSITLQAAPTSGLSNPIINVYGNAVGTQNIQFIQKDAVDATITTTLPQVAGTIWTSGNQGAGSGLDADTLDGLNSTDFMYQQSGEWDGDVNTLFGSGSYRIKNTATNVPVPGSYHSMIIFGNESNVTTQIATVIVTGVTYIRTYNSTWSAWAKVWTDQTDGSGSGLDADTLDGAQPSVSASNSTIVQRHSSGYIFANYFNTTPNDVTSGVTKVCVETGDDGYIRHGDGQSIATFISGKTMNINGSSTSCTGNAASASNAALLDNIDSTQFLRSDVDDNLTAAIVVPTANRDEGIFGTYDSYKTQHIWSMGTAYRNNAAGTNFGNLYGLAYKHTNNATGGTMAGGHQAVWCQNGTGTSAIGNGLWTSGSVTSTIASGTAPINVSSTTTCTNLNADLLDGYHGSTAATASTYALRDTAGDINARLFRSNYAEQTTAPATSADIAFRNSTTDNYIRFMSSTAFASYCSSIGIGGGAGWEVHWSGAATFNPAPARVSGNYMFCVIFSSTTTTTWLESSFCYGDEQLTFNNSEVMSGSVRLNYSYTYGTYYSGDNGYWVAYRGNSTGSSPVAWYIRAIYRMPAA